MNRFAAGTAVALAVIALAPAALAAPMTPGPAPDDKKIVESKMFGMGTGQYTYMSASLPLSEKPWWYGWTPDTTYNTGLTGTKFKELLASNPGALADLQARDGTRMIGMTANIGGRAVGLAVGIGLFLKGGAQLATYSVIGCVLAGIIVDFGTEFMTWGSLERAVKVYNDGPVKNSSLYNWSAANTVRNDFEVGLYQVKF